MKDFESQSFRNIDQAQDLYRSSDIGWFQQLNHNWSAIVQIAKIMPIRDQFASQNQVKTNLFFQKQSLKAQKTPENDEKLWILEEKNKPIEAWLMLAFDR